MAGKESLDSKEMELAKMVEYQAGAVVSRTLAEKPAGTITLFAFDAGHGLSEHSAPYDAFVYAIDGEVEITIGGVKHRVVKGQMIIMPANVPHALKAVTAFKMLLVMIRS